MAVSTDRRATPANITAPADVRRTPAVKMWALAGAAVVVFIVVCLTRWVTGPYWEQVPSGPSEMPDLMAFFTVFWQVVALPFAFFFVYRFVIKPLRQTGTFGADGVICIGACLMWFQDPLSSAGNHWFVYNTSMFNFGSWANSTPGFAAFGEPGAMTSEPILFTPAAYVFVMMLGALCGCAVMRRAAGWFPRITTGGQIAVCFVAMAFFDIVLEAILWLPMGVFEYPGGHWGLFPTSYHKYPLNEMFTMATVLTTISCLRYFKNDKGQMLIERGVDQVTSSNRSKLALRALAGIAAMQLIMFLGYNLPNGILALQAEPWPKDLQERSYFTNYLCGDGTDRVCPGPAVPNDRNGAAYISPEGQVVFPTGVTLPATVPFKTK